MGDCNKRSSTREFFSQTINSYAYRSDITNRRSSIRDLSISLSAATLKHPTSPIGGLLS
jgi:hypothetical protein